MGLLEQVGLAFINALKFMFNSESELTNSKAEEIMSNPEDRKKVIEAINKIRVKRFNGEIAEETITLSNQEEVTISS